jgi:opacity protein-like surface antigen
MALSSCYGLKSIFMQASNRPITSLANVHERYKRMLRASKVLLSLGFLIFVSRLLAQVAPSAAKPLGAYGYAQATVVDNELGYGKALGGSGGFVLQHNPWLSFDARGVIIEAREPIHTYIAELGPQVSYRFSRFTPYAEGLAGLGHTSYLTPQKTIARGWGFTYTAVAGVDFRLTRGLSWRVADLSYSHIDAGSGASPKLASTGIVYRFF